MARFKYRVFVSPFNERLGMAKYKVELKMVYYVDNVVDKYDAIDAAYGKLLAGEEAFQKECKSELISE